MATLGCGLGTRSITTTHPALACEVCGRTLLRGEQPDVFLASGQRRVVCELCVPRALHEGWLREGEVQPVSTRPDRRRRGRSLMGRLRDLREQGRPEESDGPAVGFPDPHSPADGDGAGFDEDAWEPVDEGDVDANGSAWHAPVRAPAVHPPHVPTPVSAGPDVLPREPRHIRGVPSNAELKAVRALEVFNAGEAPRRVAGVARSLGPPWVAVRVPVATGSIVSIAVSWELCWYRYEVDLGEQRSDARLVDQGLELDELQEEDRQANAQADERGELQMLAATEPEPSEA